MTPSDTAPPENGGLVPADLVEVGVYSSERAAFEHGLVVVAVGHPCWLLPTMEGFKLYVEPSAAEHARWHLDCFDRESLSWPPVLEPPPPSARALKLEFVTPLLWAIAVMASFWMQQRLPVRWEKAGLLDTREVFNHGQVWRAATALFLHADIAHLCSNLFPGIFVFATVLPTFGRLRGWLLIALASVSGNLFSALAHYGGDYRSLGASTAVFAGLGLLTGAAARSALRVGSVHRWRRLFIPIAAGLSLLGFFGSAGVNTDLTAHFGGFLSGLLAGFLAAPTTPPVTKVPQTGPSAG